MTKKTFPAQREGHFYLTEGGIETDVLYKLGYELPHFAMFPLLENAKAKDEIRTMYRRYLDVVAKYNVSALMSGADYRASPDWAELLGYSPSALADANIQAMEFLREVAQEYSDDIAETLIAGSLGPRGDAFEKIKLSQKMRRKIIMRSNLKR